MNKNETHLRYDLDFWFKRSPLNRHQYMKIKYCISTLIALLSICSGHLHAQKAPNHPVKPLLWKIEGKGLKKPSYLFGTIHLGGGALDKLHPAAQKAFDESDILLTEIPLDAKTQMGMTEKLLRKDGKTLSDSIGPDLLKKLNEELKGIHPTLDSKPFENMSTWVVSTSLPMLKAQLLGHTSVDQRLWNLAEKAKKKTDALETVDFQLGVFGGFAEEDQVKILSATLDLMQKERAEAKDSIKELTDAYVQGDAELLEQLIEKAFKEMNEGEHKELGKKLYEKLITERDKNMAETITERLKKSPDSVHFFAAGSAHFTGDPSVRSHLEKAGYNITRIEK